MNTVSVSFILPALNEEENLHPTIKVIWETLTNRMATPLSDYEIIIVNDGSTDRTGEVAHQLSQEDSHIRVINHGVNQGYGASMLSGLKSAKMAYCLALAADNDAAPESLCAVLSAIGKADLIVAYVTNPEARPFLRQCLSQVYTFLINLLFCQHLRYYNGACVIARKTLLPILNKPFSGGFSVPMEIMIRLLRQGASYHEVGIENIPRRHGKSAAISWKTLVDVIRGISSLWWSCFVQRNR